MNQETNEQFLARMILAYYEGRALQMEDEDIARLRDLAENGPGPVPVHNVAPQEGSMQ